MKIQISKTQWDKIGKQAQANEYYRWDTGTSQKDDLERQIFWDIARGIAKGFKNVTANQVAEACQEQITLLARNVIESGLGKKQEPI